MSLPVLIYLAEISERVGCLLFFLTGLLPLLAMLFLDTCDGDGIEDIKKHKKWYALFSLMMITGLLLPDKDAIYLMAGAKYSTEIAQSAEAKEVGSKILKVLNQKLDEIGGKK